MKRSRILRLTGPKKYRWLAAGWDSPLHLCVEQNGVGATLCGAKPKRLFVTRPTGLRCQDCIAIDAARQAAKRAAFRIRLRSLLNLPGFLASRFLSRA